MTELGISALFDAIVTFEAVAHPKPTPDAYLLACERLSVAPAQAVGFEDSASGFKSLTTAGIESVAIGHELADCPAGCAARSHHMDFTTIRLDEFVDDERSAR
jgi:beta-phosphoglucomutase-like phosphatase (HAD superfamily)